MRLETLGKRDVPTSEQLPHLHSHRFSAEFWMCGGKGSSCGISFRIGSRRMGHRLTECSEANLTEHRRGPGRATLLTTETSHAQPRIRWNRGYNSLLVRASSSAQLTPELIRSIRSVQVFSSRWIRAAPDSLFLNQVRAMSKAVFEVDSA